MTAWALAPSRPPHADETAEWSHKPSSRSISLQMKSVKSVEEIGGYCTPTMPAARDHRSEGIAILALAISDSLQNGVDGCPSNTVWRWRLRWTWHYILHEVAGRGTGLEWTSGGRSSSHPGIWWRVVEGKMRMAVAPVKLRTKEQASDRV